MLNGPVPEYCGWQKGGWVCGLVDSIWTSQLRTYQSHIIVKEIDRVQQGALNLHLLWTIYQARFNCPIEPKSNQATQIQFQHPHLTLGGTDTAEPSDSRKNSILIIQEHTSCNRCWAETDSHHRDHQRHPPLCTPPV